MAHFIMMMLLIGTYTRTRFKKEKKMKTCFGWVVGWWVTLCLDYGWMVARTNNDDGDDHFDDSDDDSYDI